MLDRTSTEYHFPDRLRIFPAFRRCPSHELKKKRTIGGKRKLVPCNPRGVLRGAPISIRFFSVTFLNSFNASLVTKDFHSESSAFTTWTKRLLVLQLKTPRYNIVYFPTLFLFGRFLLMGDFDAYVKCQERVSEVFQVRFRSKNVSIREHS